ncbi:hypothetical protein QBC45DRAFT_459253 [Copromyces sp. CBS 386.78]|nr:hypothetical protein QBC45DRAFT_459253 [Copromyces sp. CBS 386.78]
MAENIERMAEGLVIDLLKADKTSIPVFLPGETEYERSVANANLLYRFTRPACVVQPKNVGHVQTIVKEAKARNVPITIKCGGHSYAGFSTTDKGISLDLLNMNRVKIDVQSNTGGALWGYAYKQFVNNRMDGFIINGERCPTVGVGGFLLGGGLGLFTRSFGMGCDILKEITIVTADDTDTSDSAKGKLFWALCGAGGGNFGVMVEFKIYLQKLSNKDGSVVAGRYTWFPKSDKERTKNTKYKLMDKFIDTMNDFYTTRWPDQVTIDTSWICDLKDTSSELAVRFLLYYDGTKKDFEKLLVDKLVGADKAENGGGELAAQLTRRTMSEKSTRFLHETLVSQWSEETIKAFPTDPTFKLYASFVFKNDLEGIKKITSIIREEMAVFKSQFAGESGLLQVTWIHSSGKASRKDRSASAFRWRDGVYQTYIMLDWKEKWMEGEMRAFLKSLTSRTLFLKAFKDKLRPFSIMSRAAFINFPDAVLSSGTAERTYYGNNTKNLRLVKQQWDPDNFFKWKQGIKLPQTAEKTPAKAKRRSKTPAASPIPAEAFNAFNMSPGASSASLGAGNAFNINALGAPERDYDRRDGLADGDAVSSDDESPVNKQELTDELATKQWETFTLPPARSLMNLGSRGVLRLTDLGF